MPEKPTVDTSRLTKKEKIEIEEEKEPKSVSDSPIGKAIDLAFNPTREKIREVTIIDKHQARLLPTLDVLNLAWLEVIEIACFRQDSGDYERLFKKKKPKPSNLIDEYMYRVAQWQKSEKGENLNKITDIALAETETRGEDDGTIDADKFIAEP